MSNPLSEYFSGKPLRLLTAISVASLTVSVAALALVMWLVITEPWMEHKPSLAAYHPNLPDAQIIDAVIADLRAHEDRECRFLGDNSTSHPDGFHDWSVEPDPQDPSNPDKYLVTMLFHGSENSVAKWTFYLGNVTNIYNSLPLREYELC